MVKCPSGVLPVNLVLTSLSRRLFDITVLIKISFEFDYIYIYIYIYI